MLDFPNKEVPGEFNAYLLNRYSGQKQTDGVNFDSPKGNLTDWKTEKNPLILRRGSLLRLSVSPECIAVTAKIRESQFDGGASRRRACPSC